MATSIGSIGSYLGIKLSFSKAMEPAKTGAAPGTASIET
jgi:hypothetical protein